MTSLFLYIAVGAFAGIISGLIGIGGGIVVVPCLIYIFGFTQHSAQGTTLAMLIPPIGILAVLAYYKQGHANLPVAGLMCAGFVLGGYFGAKIAIICPEVILRRIFGACFLLIAGYMIIK
jgi:uncharacterized protein